MKERLYSIDLLRFIAAFYVMFYHYCFRGFSKDNFSIVEYHSLESIVQYGYLGVPLFFIISGFVILMSTLNSNIVDFSISRFSRLYPAYWFCLLITVIIILLYESPVFTVTLQQILFNLTMLNGFFEIPYVDGVYWSLLVELKYYILIGILLLFKKNDYIVHFSLVLLGISILQLVLPFRESPFFLKVIYFFTFPQWSSYFIAGMFFFLIYKNGKKWKYMIPILISLLVSIKYSFYKVDFMNDSYENHFSKILVCVITIIFYVVFYFISIRKLNFLNRKAFLYIGGLTYPLYLIHQNVGYIIINKVSPFVNKWVLLVCLILLMLLTSYFIHKYIERPLGSYLRSSLKKNGFLLNIKNKYFINTTKI